MLFPFLVLFFQDVSLEHILSITSTRQGSKRTQQTEVKALADVVGHVSDFSRMAADFWIGHEEDPKQAQLGQGQAKGKERGPALAAVGGRGRSDVHRETSVVRCTGADAEVHVDDHVETDGPSNLRGPRWKRNQHEVEVAGRERLERKGLAVKSDRLCQGGDSSDGDYSGPAETRDRNACGVLGCNKRHGHRGVCDINFEVGSFTSYVYARSACCSVVRVHSRIRNPLLQTTNNSAIWVFPSQPLASFSNLLCNYDSDWER